MDGTITLFLCGDVMTGRGIDQVLPRPGDPRIHEDYVGDAREYVHLAEAANGPVPRRARIINLETSITRSEDYWKGKGINYRMEPQTSRYCRRSGRTCASSRTITCSITDTPACAKPSTLSGTQAIERQAPE